MASAGSRIPSFRIALGRFVADYSEVDQFLSISSDTAGAMKVVFANVRADDSTHFEIQYSSESRIMYLTGGRDMLVEVECRHEEAEALARRLLTEVLDADN